MPSFIFGQSVLHPPLLLLCWSSTLAAISFLGCLYASSASLYPSLHIYNEKKKRHQPVLPGASPVSLPCVRTDIPFSSYTTHRISTCFVINDCPYSERLLASCVQAFERKLWSGVAMVKVEVFSRSGREIVKGGLDLQNDATVEDLKRAIQKQTRKYYPARQRLTLPLEGGQVRAIVLDNSKQLKDYFEGNYGKVMFKDLGPQVNYKTLFFFEYVGPLLIYPIFYCYPAIYTIVGLPQQESKYPVQTWALYAWTFHYTKRILETFFVHRFSHATSPISNVYRNCVYYWAFGAFIAYFVNHPLYTPVDEKQIYFGFALSVVFQLANFYTHIILKSLRSPDGKGGYQIPTGFLFNYVTCANYTTEIWQWIGFNIATQTLAGYLFLAAAGFIMTVWALGKHKRLRRAFDGKEGRAKYPQRWVIFPPLL